jgi:S1-C subfamily serine protease
MAEYATPILAPASIEQESLLAAWLLNFFNPVTTHQRRHAAGHSGAIVPSSLGDALQGLRSVDHLRELSRTPLPISAMAQRLVAVGWLTHAGSNDSASPPLNACYYSLFPLTKKQKQGAMWLTQVLGWEHCLWAARPSICRILGKNNHGDVRSGSGLLLGRTYVLTNAHVVRDMNAHSVAVGGREIAIAAVRSHDTHDVAIVDLAEPTEVVTGGLAFRDPRSIEPILIAGYPPVPATRGSDLVAQTGETCAAVVQDYGGSAYFLFSAISRPGNSGGPVFARDGRVVGIVSRSLERQPEDGDGLAPHPFFAAIPAAEVKAAIFDIDQSIDFPWETWD